MLFKILKNNKKYSGGFTLIELLVVISISTVLIATLVFQQNKWNDQLAVKTQAYELALMIRQAQIYSLGVRAYPGAIPDKFNVGYGISIDESNLDRYIFFADLDADLKYDNGEALETKILSRRVVIDRFCGNNHCAPGNGPLDHLDLSFLRPEVDANILLLNNGGNSVDNPPVTIYLESPNGQVSSVKVESNGQVSIQ